MDKPENTYPYGSIIWSLLEGDWEDLTVYQIAEVLACSRSTVVNYIKRIKVDKNYQVPYARKKAGRPKSYEW